MKKIIYILSVILIPFLTSCEVEDSQSAYPRILQAKVTYDYVDNCMLQSIGLLDLMSKVSFYAEAPANEKDGIKSYFLPNYTLTSTNDTWVLKNDRQEITFRHNKKSINEVGAIWTATVVAIRWDGDTEVISEDKNFKLESLGDKDWKIVTTDINRDYLYYFGEKAKSSSTLNVKGFDAYKNTANVYNFRVETGSGVIKLTSDEIKYNVLQPIIYLATNNSDSNFYIQSGELDIQLNSDKINAIITPSEYSPSIKVSYKGITETY